MMGEKLIEIVGILVFVEELYVALTSLDIIEVAGQ